MSAPDTNIETQERRHKGPLTGMAMVVAFAVVLLLALIMWTVSQGNVPGNDAAQIDGRTGTEVTATD